MNEDLRVQKSIESIKKAFLELALKKPYAKITITEISKIAKINRKTFYSHYIALDDVLRDVESDYVNGILEQLSALDPDDLAGGIYVYYQFLDTDDKYLKKLLYSKDYAVFFEHLSHDVMSSDFFMHFCRIGEYWDLVSGYYKAVTGIFLSWREKNDLDRDDLKVLAKKTADVIAGGLSIFAK